MLVAAAPALAVSAAALDFRRKEDVGDLHLLIPVEYLAGTTEHEGFVLAVRWPSLLPAGDRRTGGDLLFIGADQEQLSMSLPARFETMRRYVGAAETARGEIDGLQFYPRDEVLSRGHYDPGLELLARVVDGDVASMIICGADGGLVAGSCHDEFLFRQARISLSFPRASLGNWQAMEVGAQRLLLSFARTGAR